MPGRGGSKKASSPAHHKLKRLGQTSPPRQSERLTFAVYFPRPPYRGAQYRAARGKDSLYNFTGLVLGHGGATVQRIQKASGAKVEVRDAAGNLNGAHPSSHGDPSLHAWVAATSRQRLDKAVALLLDVLQPTNTQLRPVTIVPGGSAVLQPVIPPDWPEAAEAAAEAAAADAEAAAAAAAAALAAKPPPPPPPPVNAWASNRLLKQLPRQLSPVSSLQRSQGPTGSSNVSSEDEEGEAPPQVAAATSGEGVQACPPPPPPPPRSVPQSPKQPAAASHDEQPAVPSTPEQPQLPRSAPHSLSPAHEQEQEQQDPEPQQQQEQEPAGQQQMAVVFAKGLHTGSGSAGLPVTPPASPQRSPVVAQLDFGTADATVGAAASSGTGPAAAVSGSASLDTLDSSATCLGTALTGAASLDVLDSSTMSLDGTGSSAMSLGTAASSTAGLGPQLSGTSSRQLSAAPSSAASWSLWDQGGSGASFYAELQAAASDTFSIRTASSSQSAAAAHLSGGASHSPLAVASPAGALSPLLGSPPHAGTHMLPSLASPRVLHHHGSAHAHAHMGSPGHLHQGPVASPLGSPPHAQHSYLGRQLSPRHLLAHPLAPQLAAHAQLAVHQQHLLAHPLAGHQLHAAALQSRPLAVLPTAHTLSPPHALAPAAAPLHAQPGTAAPLLAPFPGLSRQGLGPSLASPVFGSPGLGSPPHAAAAALLQQQLLLAQAQQADAEHDMHQLLAAVASMATLDG